MTDLTYPRIEAALDVVDREIGVATDEREAYEALRSRLEDVEPVGASNPARQGSPAGTTVATGGRSGQRVRDAVVTAFRETVMDVPHYETEYGESVEACFATEFGTDIAVAAFDGGELGRVHVDALVARAEQAATEREEYLRVLRRERDSLTDVRDGLADCEAAVVAIGRSIDDDSSDESLDRLDERLAERERECRALAEARQRRLHRRRTAAISGVDGTSLTTFLYAEFEETCPALASITSCLRTIRHHRSRCQR